MLSTQAQLLTKIERAQGANKLTTKAARSLRRWLTAAKYAEFHTELASDIEQAHWAALEDAFCTRIQFETAGMRGQCGPGPNRINTCTIAESVQGVCDSFQASSSGEPLRAVVGFDTRIDSAWFAQVTAEVLLGNDIEVHLFREARPTPELSFAMLHLKADMGFMISASHNPPSDNGLKAYGRNAGQLLPEPSEQVMAFAKRVRNARRTSLDEGRLRGLARSIGPEMDELYHDAILDQARSDIASCTPRKAVVVFSGLHGTGESAIVPVLERAGWELGKTLFQVQSQRWPDPRFRGVPDQKPNPERPECLRAGTEMANALGADIVIASDPDADRLAVQVMDPKRAPQGVFLKGGQFASLLAYWTLSQSAAQGSLPKRGVVAHNMVTSPLMDDIAEEFPVQVRADLPIGFKYIAEVRDRLRDPQRFIMGSEQSFGTLVGAHCGEKDAASAALMACELCDDLQRAKPEPKTMVDLLEDLWLEHGYYAEGSLTVAVDGEAGMRHIAKAMEKARKQFPVELAGRQVLEVHDVLLDIVYDPKTGRKLRGLGMGWKDENILIGRLSNDNREWVIVRPSGTEPSLKMYASLRIDVGDREALPAVARATDEQARCIQEELRESMGL